MLKSLCMFSFLGLLLTLPSCSNGPSMSSEKDDVAIVLPGTRLPFPSFIRDVYPEPGSYVAQIAYITGREDEENRLFFQMPGTICVDLKHKNLLGQNDFNSDGRTYVERSHLKVSTLGSVRHSVPVRTDVVWSSESGGTLKDERGNEIGGITIVCWQVSLEPNIYEATYEYVQTSGNILSYTWSFEITD